MTMRFAETDIDRLTDYPIGQVAELMLSNAISATTLIESAIGRRNANSPKRDPYVSWDPDKALAAAHQADRNLGSGSDSAKTGTLLGVPISVKDNYGLPTWPLYAGGPDPLPERFNGPSPVVDALRRHGAIVMGKTHMVQFAYGGLGVNNHWNTPWNPFDLESHRVPGGSSTGAGLSLIEGSAMIALGSDTAGSVRIPASFTGNIGFKPSKNRWSTAGIVPLSKYLDVPGVLARRVSDLLAAFSAIDPNCESPDQLNEAIRGCFENELTLGLPDNFLWSATESSIAKRCQEALGLIERSTNANLIDVDFVESEHAVQFRHSGGTVSAELIEFYQSELPQWEHSLDPVISDRIEIAGDIDAVEYLKRVRQLEEFARSTPEAFDRCDALVCPTAPISPPKMTELEPMPNYRSINLLALQNTCIANILNLCALTLPVGKDTNGMPVGLQFLAPHGHDEQLLSIAQIAQQVIIDAGLVPWVSHP